MRRYLVLYGVVLTALLSSCTVSKRVSFLEIPSEAGAGLTPIDLDSYLDKYGNYPAVYLDFTETIEHTGGKDDELLSKWNMYIIRHERYIIVDPDYGPMTTLMFDSRPRSAYMRTVDPDGTVRMWGATDFIEEEDSNGDKEYKFVYPNVKRGTIVDAGFEWGGAAGYWTPLSHSIPLQFGFPCEHIKVSYAYPDWWEVAVKRPAPNRTIPYHLVPDPDNHKLIMEYEASDVPPVKSEPFSPYFREMADYWTFRITHLEMKGRKYDFDDGWYDQAEWWQKQYLKKTADPAPGIDSIVAEIVDPNGTTADRLTAILDWVRANIEQKGKYLNGNVEKALNTGAGSHFDICAVTQALVTAAGMQAQIVLGHDASDGPFDFAYPGSDQFVLPLVHVVDHGVPYLLIPYWKSAPYYVIPPYFSGQPALVITGPDLGDVIDLPEASAVRSLDDGNFDVTIGSDGMLTITETRVYDGTEAYIRRLEVKNLDDSQKKDYVKDLITFRDGDLNLVSFDLANLDDSHKPLTLTLKYTVGNLVTVTPEEILMNTGGLLAPISDKEYDFDPTDRQCPVRIFSDCRYHKVVTLHHPANWRLVTELPEVSDQSELGSARRTANVSSETVEIDQAVELIHCRQPKERIVDLAALIGKHSVLDLPTLIFSVEPES